MFPRFRLDALWPSSQLARLPCRPNLVIEGSAPYAEDCWHSMHLVATPEGGQPGGGTAGAHVAAAGAAVADSRAVQLASSGPCARCDVVCIHPLTGG